MFGVFEKSSLNSNSVNQLFISISFKMLNQFIRKCLQTVKSDGFHTCYSVPKHTTHVFGIQIESIQTQLNRVFNWTSIIYSNECILLSAILMFQTYGSKERLYIESKFDLKVRKIRLKCNPNEGIKTDFKKCIYFRHFMTTCAPSYNLSQHIFIFCASTLANTRYKSFFLSQDLKT